jgi:L-fucose mutarotase
MLKGIDPLLTPDLLKALAQMGHGDEIVVADANFTACSLAQGRPVLYLAGADLRRACAAVLSLLPLDAAVAQPVAYMQVGDAPPGYRSALQRQVLDDLVAAGYALVSQCEALERFAFYERAARSFAIVQTGELQPYGNFIFKKGVISDVLVR